MADELLDFGMDANLDAMIKVFGVGGGGGNAVNHMFKKGITDVGFILCNTDAQALDNSAVPVAIQLGNTLTQGLGAGNKPELGEKAAIESIDDIKKVLDHNTSMVFVTAGMGGGTGTGAAPVIAKAARDMGILTIAVVTIPAAIEGRKRFDQAIEGVRKMNEVVDSLLVINNEKIREVYGNLPASQAFGMADEILYTAVKGVAEIITLHGKINIDFADVNTVMASSKVFIMGTGFATGPDRAMAATRAALESPLLDSNDINGTSNILLNVTSGDAEVTMAELGEIIEFLQEEAGQNANIIWGHGVDPRLGDQLCVTIIATGFKTNPSKVLQEKPKAEKVEAHFEEFDQQILMPEEPEEEFEFVGAQSEVFEKQAAVENPYSAPQNRPRPANSIPRVQVVASKESPRREEPRPEPIKSMKNEDPEVKEQKIDNWFTRKFNMLFEE
jgi:cell division protein FtsZ